MSLRGFFETLSENATNQVGTEITVTPRPNITSESLMQTTDEKSAQEGDVINGLKWGDLNTNQHGFVNFCLHALGLGVKGKRSHDTRDDFTIR